MAQWQKRKWADPYRGSKPYGICDQCKSQGAYQTGGITEKACSKRKRSNGRKRYRYSRITGCKCKIYLTASSAVRAKRRYEEQKAKGIDCNLEEIEKDIIERDHRDMTREISPLKQAEDAILLDSSNMTIEEVADAVIALCK